MNTKRIIALLLALVMLFSFAACNTPEGDPCENGHVDADGDKKCDRCQEDMPDDDDGDGDGDGGDDSYLAPTISEAIWAQLQAASSVKIDFSFSFESVYDGYDYDYDENENLVIEKSDDVDKMDVKMSMVLSKAESGFNAMITLTATEYQEDENGNLTPDKDTETVYIIDGSGYSYDEDLGAYVESMMPTEAALAGSGVPTAISEMLSELLAELEISDADVEAIKAELGAAITAIFEIVDKKGDFNINFKTYLDELFAYVDEIDVETKTLESLIDDALHLVDEELSVENILNKVKSFASLTVAEALAELDAWLTENYETTLQGIYDTVVADERVELLVRFYLQAMGSESGEPVTDADVKAFLDELKAVKVDEFIAAYVDTDTVLYDLVMSLISSMGGAEGAPSQPGNNPNVPMSDELEGTDEPDYPPINTLFGAIADFLDLTLAEFEAEIGNPIFTTIKESISGITINTLMTESTINFTDGFALDELSFGTKADIVAEFPYALDDTKTEKTAFKFDYSFKISNISDSPVEITLPAGTKTVFGIFNSAEFFRCEDGVYDLELYWPKDADGDGVFTLNGELFVEDYSSIAISMVMPTARQNTYVFDYVNYNNYTMGKLSITFDYESFTYAVQFIN